jgi:hypothetical protein
MARTASHIKFAPAIAPEMNIMHNPRIFSALIMGTALAALTALSACSDDASGAAGDANSADAVATVAAPEAANAAADAAATDNSDPSRREAAAPAGPSTTMTFEENHWDFGTIDEGDVVTHNFIFTNTGTEPLILDRCKGSCGCTVPKCPKEPIAPGETGSIEVKFNSKNKKNKQTKTITINANTVPEQTRITIGAQVTPDPNAPVKSAPAAPASGSPVKQ